MKRRRGEGRSGSEKKGALERVKNPYLQSTAVVFAVIFAGKAIKQTESSAASTASVSPSVSFLDSSTTPTKLRERGKSRSPQSLFLDNEYMLSILPEDVFAEDIEILIEGDVFEILGHGIKIQRKLLTEEEKEQWLFSNPLEANGAPDFIDDFYVQVGSEWMSLGRDMTDGGAVIPDGFVVEGNREVLPKLFAYLMTAMVREERDKLQRNLEGYDDQKSGQVSLDLMEYPVLESLGSIYQDGSGMDVNGEKNFLEIQNKLEGVSGFLEILPGSSLSEVLSRVENIKLGFAGDKASEYFPEDFLHSIDDYHERDAEGASVRFAQSAQKGYEEMTHGLEVPAE